jgi:tripartite-type tricarboxylate transporter receptor subunit TctC
MKAFATTAKKRLPELPDVPTMAEAGFPGSRQRELERPIRPCKNAARYH